MEGKGVRKTMTEENGDSRESEQKALKINGVPINDAPQSSNPEANAKEVPDEDRHGRQKKRDASSTDDSI